MRPKYFGPCSIVDCTYTNVNFRSIMEVAYTKCQEKRTLETYPYLKLGNQLCHPHYCKIVEGDIDNYIKEYENVV